MTARSHGLDQLSHAESLVDAFERAVMAVSSYDVYVSAERTLTAKVLNTGELGRSRHEIVYRNSTSRDKVKWRALRDDERTPTMLLSRQSRDARGRYSYERFDDDGADWEVRMVFTGRETRRFTQTGHSGGIQKARPNQQPFADEAESYPALFRELFYGGDLVKFLKERSSLKALAVKPGTDGVVVLEAEPHAEARMYPNFTVRVALNPDWGLLPKSIEYFVEEGKRRLIRYDITEVREVQAGVWVPLRAIMVRGPVELPRQVSEIAVDVARSRWNTQIPDSRFLLPFPPGARIIDQPRGISYVSGEGDLGADADRLIATAHSFVPPDGAMQVAPVLSQNSRVLIVAIAIAGLMSLVVLVFYRRSLCLFCTLRKRA